MSAPDESESTVPLPRAAPQRFPHTNVGPGPRAENEARLGRRVGPYRLERLLGHGGMGAVYLAKRDDGEFEREVALKLIRHGGEDEISRRRFERERRILSRLEHPAIARLYDGGVDEDTGAPWFAMERIEGENLNVWAAKRRLSLRDRVALVIAIGHAVQYAHQQLVIHRDLKPSNLMIDRDGAPHVLDFGIAALIDEHEADRTAPRTAINTPEYAAPEQIEGAPISAATDVYTLGVILFELLTGVRPFEDPHATPFATQRAVLEAPTPALIDRLSNSPDTQERLVAERSTTPSLWRRTLRSDLDAVVRKALEKRPQDRYPSMSAFVEDLQRWLDGRTVQAAHASLWYRGTKFVRRHQLALGLIAGAFALLGAATLISLQQAQKARQEAERAEAVKQFLVSLFVQTRPAEGGSAQLTAQQLLDQGRDRLQGEVTGQPRLTGELLNTIGTAYAHLGYYTQAAAQLQRALEFLPAQDETLRPRLEVLVDLADLLSHQGRLVESERAANEAQSLIERLRAAEASPWGWLGADSRLVRIYFGDWQSVESRAEDLALVRARLLDLRGRRHDAIELRRQVADVRNARPGEHPTRVRTANNDLALALSDVGQQDEAIALLRKQIEDNERQNGPGHVSALTIRHNLAQALQRADRLDEAETLQRETAALAARALPPTHPRQANIAYAMGNILRSQYRLDEAQTWYEKALGVCEQQAEIGHNLKATVLYGIALNRLAQHEAGAAQTALDQASQLWTEAFGPEHARRTTLALQRVAIALQRGDAEAAHAALETVAALQADEPEPDAREALQHVRLWAQWLRSRGELEPAATVLSQRGPAAQIAWPAPHLELLLWRLAQAEIALDAGHRDSAQTYFEDAQALQAQRHAPAPPELAEVSARLR